MKTGRRAFFNKIGKHRLPTVLEKKQMFSCKFCEIFNFLYFKQHYFFMKSFGTLSFQLFLFHLILPEFAWAIVMVEMSFYVFL